MEPDREHEQEKRNTHSLVHTEWPLLASVLTSVLFLIFGGRWLADLSNPAWFAFTLI